MHQNSSAASTPSDVIEVYDTVSQTWNASLRLSTPRAFLAAAAINNFVLFAGGRDKVNRSYGSRVISTLRLISD